MSFRTSPTAGAERFARGIESPAQEAGTFAQGAERRQQLWRVDWRFLLPVSAARPFGRLLLAGGTPALAALLLELGITREVEQRPEKAGEVDAVVILHDTPASPETILPRLQSGAQVYWEIDRFHRPSSYLQDLSRRCREWGLAPTGLYAVSPNFEQPQLFLPLQARWALEWYVRTLYDAKEMRQFLLEKVLTGVTGLRSDRFARIAPYVAVTAAAVGGGSASRQPWRGGGALPPAGLDASAWEPDQYPLLLTDGGNRVTLLPFSATSRMPLRVLKIPKQARFNNRTWNEQQVLETLGARVEGAMRESIPAPLGTERIGEVIAGVESYLPGCSLLRRNGRWKAGLSTQLSDFALAVEWLINFHQEGVVHGADCADQGEAGGVERLKSLLQRGGLDVAEETETLLAAFEADFGVTEPEAELFRQMRQRALALRQFKLPVVTVHRDYNVWNLYRDGDRLNVIDWEGGQPGLPLCDLLHFATHWHETAQQLDGLGERLEAFALLFTERGSETALTVAVDGALTYYMKRLEIQRGFLPLLLGYTWVELALRRHKQQQDMGERNDNPRQGNQNFAFLALLARQAERLFVEEPDA